MLYWGLMRDILKALEIESLSLYRGSMRETWREDSYTEGTERCIIEGSGNGAFFL
jgi:hypothetical protein